MKMVCIENAGEIDTAGLAIFGASVKESDAAIGMFGTGAKYAIAYLLRNNIAVRIFSGREEIPITISTRSLRGKEIKIAQIGDESLFSIELGAATWELWHALRELISNAMDEGGFRIVPEATAVGLSNSTRVLIEQTPEVEAIVLKDPGMYFSRFRPIDDIVLESRYITVYKRRFDAPCIYYKNVRCFNPRSRVWETSVFDYNLEDTVKIRMSELREAVFNQELAQGIYNAMRDCADPTYLRPILEELGRPHKSSVLERSVFSTPSIFNPWTGLKKYLETNKDGHTWVATTATHKSLPATERQQTVCLPEDVVQNCYDASFGKPPSLHPSGLFATSPYNPTPVEADRLLHAISMLEATGRYSFERVVPVTTSSTSKLGFTVPGERTIFITELGLKQDEPDIAKTLVEEFTHSAFGVADCTRDMQEALLTQIINLIYTGE